jgi:hypothetical protein
MGVSLMRFAGAFNMTPLTRKENDMELQDALRDNFSTENDHFDFKEVDQTALNGRFLIEGGYLASPQIYLTNVEAKESLTEDVVSEAVYTTSSVQDAIQTSLIMRDIDTSDITDMDMALLDTAAAQIALVLSSDIETTTDIEDLFGDDLNITLVDDLTALDSTSLDGAAVVETDEIILDSALEGDELRTVLAEEIAETVYQDVYGETSAGDFGAELVAILNGEDDDVIAAYSETSEIDTVETEYGTAEAAGTDMDTSVEEAVDVIEDVLGWDVTDSETDASGYLTYGSTLTSAYYEDDGGQDNGTEMWGESVMGTTYEDVENALLENGTYDFDGDGNETTEFQLFLLGGTVDLDGYDEEITNYDDLEYIAIDELSATLVASSGSATFEYWITESYTYETGTEFSYSEAVETTTGYSTSGLSISSSSTSTTTETVSTSSSFTGTTTVRNTYTVDGSDYDEGTSVSYGAHAQVADIEYTDSLFLYFAAIDSDGGEGFFSIDADEITDIDDYLVDIVQTDVASNDLLG